MIRLIDIASSTARQEDSFRQVMERINQRDGAEQFQIVVDSTGKVLGTVTDGDLRRAILRGASLEEPVANCMQQSFRYGKVGERERNEKLLENVGSKVLFLPILDEEGRLVEIIGPKEPSAHDVHALVMAGGFGRRLGARTRNTPKPLLPVGGRPILEHILDRLRDSGVPKVSVSVHYLGEQIENYVRSREDSDRIAILRETEPMGTAGAVRQLVDEPFENLLVLNGDILTSLQLGAFMDFHAEQRNEATIAAATHEVRIPYGVIRYAENGAFEGIEEKPMIRHYVSAGINLLSRRICELIPERSAIDMPTLLQAGRDLGLRIGVFPIHEYWTDVGRPEDLDRADAVYKRA